jgi:hypothetical protein
MKMFRESDRRHGLLELVYYAFDLADLDGRDTASLPLTQSALGFAPVSSPRKFVGKCLAPEVAAMPAMRK